MAPLLDLNVQALDKEGARLLTTSPCVTEATHMLANAANRIDLLHWIAAGAAQVVDFPAIELIRMADWIRRYSGRRDMDFADASLVWLATVTEVTDILTIDHNDFERYRLPDGRSFSIL